MNYLLNNNLLSKTMSTITVRIPDELDPIIKEFCEEEDRSKSWLVKRALKEKLKEWKDLKLALKARVEYEKNPESFLSHEDFWRKIEKKEQRK
jgi:predicted DNA-binding protein